MSTPSSTNPYSSIAFIPTLKQKIPNNTCVLCEKQFLGWGNNAEPLSDGICCNQCFNEVIFPQRNLQLKIHALNEDLKNLSGSENKNNNNK
jgi:hypothetical protein